MDVVGGMVYADDMAPEFRVVQAKALAGHRLWVRFNDGAARVFDVTSLLAYPVFQPLADRRCFETVTMMGGAPTWNGGTIDIAPETLYYRGDQVAS